FRAARPHQRRHDRCRQRPCGRGLRRGCPRWRGAHSRDREAQRWIRRPRRGGARRRSHGVVELARLPASRGRARLSDGGRSAAAVRYSSVEVVTTMSTRGRPRGRRGLLRLSLTLIAGGWLLLASSVHAAGPEVIVLPTTGIVDDSMAKYLADNIAIAEQRGAAAVVIKLNTPGGALTSTNDIVGTLLEAKVPIIVWVAPAGGFAASAGTFITLASNIALMAPGTSIGAASPVGGQGEDIGGTLGDKIKNDAIAKITAIAEERGRNVDWAISTVKDAKSSPASEAVAVGVVDGIASTIEDVIAFANGKTVQVRGQDVTLDLAGAVPVEVAMSPFISFLRLLSDPTIAF